MNENDKSIFKNSFELCTGFDFVNIEKIGKSKAKLTYVDYNNKKIITEIDIKPKGSQFSISTLNRCVAAVCPEDEF